MLGIERGVHPRHGFGTRTPQSMRNIDWATTAYPSFASSFAILRRLQSGFSRPICSMRLTSSSGEDDQAR